MSKPLGVLVAGVALFALATGGCEEAPKMPGPGPGKPPAGAPAAREEVPTMPMAARGADSAAARWRAKKVLKSRLLDDMENLDGWRLGGGQGGGEMVLTDERAVDGKHSLRLRSPTKGLRPSSDGNPFGSTAVMRAFDNEDWTAWNRLSFWVYPHLPGHHAVSMRVSLYGFGAGMGDAIHYFLLENGKWNRVVWEIPHIPRDRVFRLRLAYTMNGNEAGAAEIAQFDIDHLELQKVRADPYEGWYPTPGRIAFSHTGYPTGGPKAAIAAGLTAKRFELVDAASGKTVLSKPIRTADTRIGRFQVLDFTEHQAEGVYRLRAGGAETRDFRIAADVWRRTLWKAINFFYAQRCGCKVPGVHGVCHADWRAEHEGKWIVLNGGWHDAGDMSQGLVNSSEATYAMFDLVRRLRARGEDGALVRRLLAEARWGLSWVMKTSFRDGYRLQWAEHRFWTNSKVGDVDDVTAKANYDPAGSFYAAAAEAVAANVLKPIDPNRAAEALRMAREDWRFGAERFEKIADQDLPVENLGVAVLAAAELYRATGEKPYALQACLWAGTIVASQQKKVPPGLSLPITGWFHRTARRREPLRYYHRCHEQAPVLALIRLCQVLPEDRDWIEWYAAVTLWSQYYQKAMAAFTRPYGLLANSVWHVDEHRREAKVRQPRLKALILAGLKAGDDWYVRAIAAYPYSGYRGNNGTVLTQTKGLAAAGHLRGDLAAAELCQEQLYWVLGRNPFRQSLMYGEGYDFPPLYSPRSGHIVGALPVGIKNRGSRDLPYWPNSTLPCYKEIWVHPVSRWISLMGDLGGQPIVRGVGAPRQAVTFREVRTGIRHAAQCDGRDGRFRLSLPAGRYEVASGPHRVTATLLPAGVYELDLRPSHALDLRVEHRTAADGQVTIVLHAAGAGRHRFELRAHNLRVSQAVQTAELKPRPRSKLTWQGKVDNPAAPWVAVLIPDGDLSRRVEATGLAKP